MLVVCRKLGILRVPLSEGSRVSMDPGHLLDEEPLFPGHAWVVTGMGSPSYLHSFPFPISYKDTLALIYRCFTL